MEPAEDIGEGTSLIPRRRKKSLAAEFQFPSSSFTHKMERRK
jgi:hypothetical protein